MPTGTLITRQPAVVGYGNGALEMVAAASNGSLYHWRFLNGAWSKPVQVDGNILGRPLLVNFGSGQLMLVALGTDRRPYFWSYANGTWSNFWRVPTNLVVDERYISSLAVSSWGDGTVDLGFVEYQTGALFHGRLNASILSGIPIGEAFTRVGGALIDIPVVTALSPSRINVLAVGTDRRVYSAWTSAVQSSQFNPIGIVWSGYMAAGASTGVRVGGVLKLGSGELVAVGTDLGGHIEISRYNGFTWRQFKQAVSQDTSTVPLASPLYRPATSNYSN